MNPRDDLRQQRSPHQANVVQNGPRRVVSTTRRFEHLNVRSQGSSRAGLGVFGTIDEAMKAAAVAQRALVALGLETRKRIIAEIRAECHRHVQKMAEDAVAETGLGRVDQTHQKPPCHR